MNETREEFLRRQTEHAQKLDDLAGELQTLDLSEISQKVGFRFKSADVLQHFTTRQGAKSQDVLS